MFSSLNAAVRRIVIHQTRLCSARNPNAFVNHYAVLGVATECDLKDVQAAFRRLAKQLHPDANPGKNTNQQFAEIRSDTVQIEGDEQCKDQQRERE